jgi:hypothetical protein
MRGMSPTILMMTRRKAPPHVVVAVVGVGVRTRPVNRMIRLTLWSRFARREDVPRTLVDCAVPLDWKLSVSDAVMVETQGVVVPRS